MRIKMLFFFSFENGWGDTFLSVFDIVNCVDFLKREYPQFDFTLIVNDKFNVRTLPSVLNIEFFDNFFNEFEIRNTPNLFCFQNGSCSYNGLEYKRMYSGRNPELFNNINGIFDVYLPVENYDEVKNLNITFIDFTFNDIDDRPKDFNVFHPEIVKNVKEFIETNFIESFDAIYYRSLPILDLPKVEYFRQKLLDRLDTNKNYFICSNSSLAKQSFLETNLKLKMFRDISTHNPNHIGNGFTRLGQTVDEAINVVSELIILGFCENIYYAGDISNISLFNWYATNIKKAKLIQIPV
jgi:hypothetical protein